MSARVAWGPTQDAVSNRRKKRGGRMEEGKKRRGRRTKPNDQTQTEADNQENMVQMLTFLDMDPARTLASSREGTASEESQQRTRVCF